MTTRTIFDPMSVTKYFKGMKPPNLDELRAKRTKYIDPYFPPTENSLTSKNSNGEYTDPQKGYQNERDFNSAYPRDKHGWRRISELGDGGGWKVFSDKIEPADVTQGMIGDCYLISAIAALTEYPNLIFEKFRTREYNDIGYYEMILFIDGEWQIVFVDDYFPFYGNQFVFAQPNTKEMYAILLEKAWAKVNGGYSNISYGCIFEILLLLTGFPSEIIKNDKEKPMELYNKIEDANDEGAVMGCGSYQSATGRDDTKNRGNIVFSHAYTLIDAKSIKQDDIHLLKIRNPWGKIEWNGAWSDTSSLWTPNYKGYFGHENKEDGTFFMNIDDYVQNYAETHICHILYGSKIKTYNINYEDYYKYPLVWNIKMPQKGKVQISIVTRDRRFNRRIPENEFKPFSLLLFRYNKNYEVDRFYGANSHHLYLSLNEELEAGYYAAVVYIPYEYLNLGEDFKYSLSIASKVDYVSKFTGKDTSFQCLELLLINYYKTAKQYDIANCQKYIMALFEEVHRSTNISPIILYNNMGFTLRFNLDFQKTKGYRALGRFKNQNVIQIDLPDRELGIVLFALTERSSTLSYSGSLRSTQTKGTEFDNYNPENLLKFDFNEDLDQVDSNKITSDNYTFISKDTSQDIQDIPKFDKDAESKTKSNVDKVNPYDMLKKDYPKEFETMEKYVKEKPEHAKNPWIKTKAPTGVYAGQISEDKQITGRGIFTYNDGRKYIGHWTRGNMDGYGILYNADGTIAYQGDFKNGAIEGNGIYYLPGGHYYIGGFQKNKMNGYGALHYNNGNSWEGEFKDHKKNGIGLLKTNTGDYLLCEFENDVLKGKVPLSGDEVEFFKHRGEKMRGIQDQYILGLIEPSTLDKERKEYLDEMRKVYDYKTNPNAIAPAFMDVKRKKTKNERANPVPFERFESDLSMGDGENFEVKDKETERKEKLEKEENKTKNPFMYEQLRDMCPNLRSKDYKLYETHNPYTQFLKNIPEGSTIGGGAYFDGNYYYIGDFGNKYPNGRIRKFNKDQELVFEGQMKNSFVFEDGPSKKYFPNGDVYEGNVKDEKMHGNGKITFANGDQYIGMFENDKPHGKGKYIEKKGNNQYDVQYDNGTPISKSMSRQQDKYVSTPYDALSKLYPEDKKVLFECLNKIPPYVSQNDLEWKELIPYNPTDEGYYGQVKKGTNIKHGRGIQYNTWNDGKHSYVGNFEDNKRSGVGYLLNDHCVTNYEGQFKDDTFNGFGKLTTDDYTYIGNFKNGLPDKYGSKTLHQFPGVETMGIYKDGKERRVYKVDPNKGIIQKQIYNDQGILVREEEPIDTKSADYQRKIKKQENQLKDQYRPYINEYQQYPPLYENMRLVPVAKHATNGMYVGEVNEMGQKHGRGVLINNNKGRYVGYFMNDLKEKAGKIYDGNGRLVYEGQFDNDKPMGHGFYYLEDGTIIEGEFDANGSGKGKIIAGPRKSDNIRSFYACD